MIFGKFNDKAQLLIVEAQRQSEYFHHGYIGTEHILLALLRLEGDLKNVLLINCLTYDKIKKITEDVIGFGDEDVFVWDTLLTPRVKRLFDDSLITAKKYSHNFVSPEHILLTMLINKDGIGYTLLVKAGININFLCEDIKKLIEKDNFTLSKNKHTPKRKEIKSTLLSKYSTDLTRMAELGELDPVIGRDTETQRVLEILCRRIKNNPCLIGEPGVGKTAVIEGLAQKIIERNVPEILQDKRILMLDITSMVAGAKYRGEFEDRLKKVVDEIVGQDDIIIFIDEIHTIVGAGGAEGAIDASNILKPALARGIIKCIGATTIDEYRKSIEKDSALERRFQVVNVKEPSREDTKKILYGLKTRYQDHHGIEITEEAINAAINYSERYLIDRFWPDKAIDLLDEAAAKLKIDSMIIPEHIKELQDNLNSITRKKNTAIKEQDYEKASSFRDEESVAEDIYELEIDKWKQNNKHINIKLKEQDIARVVSLLTDIPVERVTSDEMKKLLNLEDILNNRVIGQEEAVGSIVRSIKRARVGLKDPLRPIGVFLFCGPTGVGKTELCRCLAENIFDSEKKLIRIDMSEYMEKHSVSRLIGPPPGYVGYEEGGHLTEAVRRNPYSVILLDEIEKANSDVFNILLQIMEDGRLTDGKGKLVNFKNTIIIMTSNLGIEGIKKQNSLGFSIQESNAIREEKEINNIINDSIKKKFKPEFLNRIDEIIIFKSLKNKDIIKIADLMLSKTIDRLFQKKIYINLSSDISKFIADKNRELHYGARPIKRLITKELEDKICEELLNGNINIGDNIKVDVKGEALEFNKIVS